MTGPAFFKLAFRLGAYESVIRARLREAQRRQDDAGPQPDRPLYGPSSGQREVVPATRDALQAHPEFSKMLSFGTARRQQ